MSIWWSRRLRSAAGGSTRALAAASSIAKGSPSNLATISSITRAWSWVGSKVRLPLANPIRRAGSSRHLGEAAAAERALAGDVGGRAARDQQVDVFGRPAPRFELRRELGQMFRVVDDEEAPLVAEAPDQVVPVPRAPSRPIAVAIAPGTLSTESS